MSFALDEDEEEREPFIGADIKYAGYKEGKVTAALTEGKARFYEVTFQDREIMWMSIDVIRRWLIKAVSRGGFRKTVDDETFAYLKETQDKACEEEIAAMEELKAAIESGTLKLEEGESPPKILTR